MFDYLPPSKRNKAFSAIPNVGKCCITTVVSGLYQWYIPLFIDRVRKEYPGYDVRVYYRGKMDAEFPGMEFVVQNALPDHPSNPYTTAALRFVHEDEFLRSYDYVFITDIDMMIMRESPTLVDQHMMDLRKNGLECYSNFVNGAPGMPGVHFITKDWWGRTKSVRDAYLQYLVENSAGYWSFDEVMIYDIVRASGLAMSTRPNLWYYHGVHLGDYRRSVVHKTTPVYPDAFSQMYIKKMLGDEAFMKIVDKCSEHIPSLSKTFDMFRRF